MIDPFWCTSIWTTTLGDLGVYRHTYQGGAPEVGAGEVLVAS